MAAGFHFAHRVAFVPEDAEAILRQVPAAPGVFALRGEREGDEPYLTRAADLRRRLRRLLAPPEAVDEQGRPVLSKRLNLRERVRWIEWTRTGSEFESVLTLYSATRTAFGAEQARKRMRLYPPYMVRVTATHEHPRVYVTNRLSKKSLAESFGPFASRAAAERYCDAVLDLFRLRRCHEDLVVHPEHPGCAYGEMNKCMAPCKGACSAEEYEEEARQVAAFLRTGGESFLSELAAKREAASEEMDFEAAASLHKRWEQVKAATALADELVRPVAELRALVVQEAAPDEAGEGGRVEEAAVFLLERGCVHGPERLSTLGVRAVREQTAVGSSLFAQPLMLAAVVEGQVSRAKGQGHQVEVSTISNELPAASGQPDGAGAESSATSHQLPVASSQPGGGGTGGLSTSPEPSAPSLERVGAGPDGLLARDATLPPEDRARTLVERLEAEASGEAEPDAGERGDFLALFRRWYYRPVKQRAGEVLLPNADDSWPLRRLLNAAARVALGPPKEMETVDREGFKDLKTKVIHAGREGVEKVVPVLPKRSRARKSVTPADVV